MGIWDILSTVADVVSVTLDQNDRDAKLKELEEENRKLELERDYAIDLNNQKDDFVRSLGGRLLQKGDPEGGRLLSDYKKYKKSNK